MQTLNCPQNASCGGCPWGDREHEQHRDAKQDVVGELFPGAKIVYSPTSRVRDRADLIWEGERIGLYGRASREVLDLENCVMMSEALEAWFQRFRLRVPPLAGKGSVRLRVSPSGERGVWLDFANQDVQRLFAQREYLEWLSGEAFVEIGQRRKALTWIDGQPKLRDPQMKAWFETYGPHSLSINLYGPVGGFSQVGFAANRALVQTVCELAEQSGRKSWLELFSGNGNFALALAARGHQVEAVELDPLALEGMQRSIVETGLDVKISRADVYLQTGKLPALEGRGLLVDPPRAGLRELLVQLQQGARPVVLLYVSCFSEVFLRDAASLKALGYRLRELKGVDQFPYSAHCEWVGLFEL